MKKYELLENDKIKVDGVKLYRIKALRDIINEKEKINNFLEPKFEDVPNPFLFKNMQSTVDLIKQYLHCAICRFLSFEKSDKYIEK